MPKIPKNLSARLSIILTGIVLAALLILTVTLPTLTCFFLHSAHADLLEDSYPAILAILYTALLPAYAAAISLLLLLRNVRRGRVFCAGSVSYLRLISWCCFAETAVFAALGVFFSLSFLLSFAALFMGLILRVVKNVIEEAAAIKDENDLTV